MRRIIIGITGASGSIYGVRLLQHLSSKTDVEVHLIVSAAGHLTLSSETEITRDQIEQLANFRYSDKDIGASIASGSFNTDAMIIAPCSMKTLASIASGVSNTLVSRAADVVLKERRRLILLARETPLHLGHLKNMLAVTEMGGIVFPPVPAFYTHPQTVSDIVDNSVGRVLGLCGIRNDLTSEWPGLRESTD